MTKRFYEICIREQLGLSKGAAEIGVDVMVRGSKERDICLAKERAANPDKLIFVRQYYWDRRRERQTFRVLHRLTVNPKQVRS